MKLIIEFAQEDINSTTLSLIERLFKSTEVKTVTDSNTKTTRSTTANIELYDLDDILPQTPNSKDNATRLKEFAASIENTLGDKEKKALSKFLDFYLPKIDNWKQGVNLENLWSKWLSSER